MDAVAARAHANIALIKYWGKRDATLNLPATGSISVTLAALYTDVRVAFRPALAHDDLRLESGGDPARLSAFLDLIRARAGIDYRAEVVTRNNFPTGAGLASSASAFAGLALAGSRAAGLQLDDTALSALARQGSGSAARSIFGGYAEMCRGSAVDGSDAHARSLAAPEDWPLAVVIAITDAGVKKTGSTVGMQRTAQTSPFYRAWVDSAEADLAAARAAIAARDFVALGELAEYSALKMHGLMLSARPGLMYWNAATVAALHAVRGLREAGTLAFATIDAGPQVKTICAPEQVDEVAVALRAIDGVQEVRSSALGPGAHPIDDPWA